MNNGYQGNEQSVFNASINLPMSRLHHGNIICTRSFTRSSGQCVEASRTFFTLAVSFDNYVPSAAWVTVATPWIIEEINIIRELHDGTHTLDKDMHLQWSFSINMTIRLTDTPSNPYKVKSKTQGFMYYVGDFVNSICTSRCMTSDCDKSMPNHDLNTTISLYDALPKLKQANFPNQRNTPNNASEHALSQQACISKTQSCLLNTKKGKFLKGVYEEVCTQHNTPNNTR